MIELVENTVLKIDKVWNEEIIIKNNIDLELDIIKYLNLNLNITISKKTKANIYLITNHNLKINLNINIEEDSSVKLFVGLFNKKSNTDIKVNLIGKNSNVNLSLINLLNKGMSTHNTIINHLNEGTNSIVNNKSILNNASTCLMDIKSNIKNKSNRSNTSQTIEAICLDNKSKLEMLPTLFINENDIFANHSSSVARISDADLYYIMSKGISRDDANKLYAMNFLLKLTPEDKKEKIEKMIERTL